MEQTDKQEYQELVEQFISHKYSERQVVFETRDILLDFFHEIKLKCQMKWKFFYHYLEYVNDISIIKDEGKIGFIFCLRDDIYEIETLFTITYEDKLLTIFNGDRITKIRLKMNVCYHFQAESFFNKIANELRQFFYNFWIDDNYRHYPLIFRVRLKKYIKEEFLRPIMIYDCAGAAKKMNLATRENKEQRGIYFSIMSLCYLRKNGTILPFAIYDKHGRTQINSYKAIKCTKRAINKLYGEIFKGLPEEPSDAIRMIDEKTRQASEKKIWERILNYFLR